MFWGKPICEHCDYQGPDLMWMWHHGIGLHVLVQDRASHELRAVEIDDGPQFYRNEGESEEDRQARSAEHVNGIMMSKTGKNEQTIDQSRIAHWEFESHGTTDILCPRCGELLKWQGTGIS